MYRSRGWSKVKHGGGSMIYTYEGGHGNYTLNDFATYNKGVLSLNCYVRDCGDIDEHQAKRRLSDYFRQYGKRIVVAEKNGKRLLKRNSWFFPSYSRVLRRFSYFVDRWGSGNSATPLLGF